MTDTDTDPLLKGPQARARWAVFLPDDGVLGLPGERPPGRRLRMLLGRQIDPAWEPGAYVNAVGWVGLNPARADDEEGDLTLSKIIGFTRRWRPQATHVVLANLWILCATDPADLAGWLRANRADHPDAPESARNAYARVRCDTAFDYLDGWCDEVVCAWGAPSDGQIRRRLPYRTAELENRVRHRIPLLQIGDGRTLRHPSRAAYSLGLHPLDRNVLGRAP